MFRCASCPCAPIALVAIVLATWPTLTLAQPIVRVRAETRIELRVDRRPDQVSVAATLRDDRGAPLPGRALEIAVREPAPVDGTGGGISRGRELGETDDAGELVVAFPLSPGRFVMSARFEGEPSYRMVEVEQVLDLSRAHVRLGLSMAGEGRLDRLDLDVPRHRVVVRAESLEGGAGLAVTIDDESARRLASGITDAEGSVELVLDSAALGPPAAGKLIVGTEGDALRSAAQTEIRVVRFRPIQLTLEGSQTEIDADERVTVRGRLHDSEGPLARRAVGLFAEERHITTVLTDDDGALVRALDLAEDLPDGAGVVALTARFASDAPWRPDARSAVVTVTVRELATAPWPWLALPMLACGLALLALARRGRSAAAAEMRPPPPAPAGIAPGRGGGRAAERSDVGGRVADAADGRALASASVHLRSARASHRSATDPEGRFAFPEVAPGAWALTVEADGYEPRKVDILVPHRGEWSSAQVRLASLRHVAIRHYRPVAEALAPDHRWWAHWTPRELVERARREQRPPILSLTEAIERVAYGPAHATADEVDEIERQSKSVLDRLGSE